MVIGGFILVGTTTSLGFLHGSVANFGLERVSLVLMSR